ncbi:hypothetical protein Niako_2353 [Niastella koreensis GR20-10]|uniref:Uncharacterized protein n=1 Tax=Niastella koreensis (strain DSM 17620 / KACC 11465 / NBRC 106392 / GR20-10) TaxID=700598 RepID=G8TKM3_NIAKG|nr:hypothetical protein [Niastella koreensis]AEV98697.1 hypothetical protein Niako_2353 [Niastella koreensis GR20-10]
MSGHIVERKGNRYYFHNGQLIRWIDEHGKIMEKKPVRRKGKSNPDR